MPNAGENGMDLGCVIWETKVLESRRLVLFDPPSYSMWQKLKEWGLGGSKVDAIEPNGWIEWRTRIWGEVG